LGDDVQESPTKRYNEYKFVFDIFDYHAKDLIGGLSFKPEIKRPYRINKVELISGWFLIKKLRPDLSFLPKK
jgi:hypothetical protein